MNEISSEKLKKKIDNKDDFKLVFYMKEDYFRKKHIPGSILMATYRERALDLSNFRKEIQQLLDIDDEIVVIARMWHVGEVLPYINN